MNTTNRPDVEVPVRVHPFGMLYGAVMGISLFLFTIGVITEVWPMWVGGFLCLLVGAWGCIQCLVTAEADRDALVKELEDWWVAEAETMMEKARIEIYNEATARARGRALDSDYEPPPPAHQRKAKISKTRPTPKKDDD